MKWFRNREEGWWMLSFGRLHLHRYSMGFVLGFMEPNNDYDGPYNPAIRIEWWRS